MARSGQRKCLFCGGFFDPDARNRERQRYCADAACQRASKAASQAAWLAKPENSGYFRDPAHVARVQAWRAANPGHGSGKRRLAPALQDALIAQVIDPIEESFIRGDAPEIPPAPALQDLLNAPSPVLAGLIAHLFEVTLQEDIAAATRRLVQLGNDVIHGGAHEASQASAAARAAALRARAVQLG